MLVWYANKREQKSLNRSTTLREGNSENANNEVIYCSEPAELSSFLAGPGPANPQEGHTIFFISKAGS